MVILQVSATPCDAWRVSRIIPTWRHTVIQESSLNDEVGENKSVNVTMADFSAPHKLYVPKYGGQIYILVGVASAAFVGAGIITLMVSWAVIVWNVRVAAGKDTPWWAYTANRCACQLASTSVQSNGSVGTQLLWLCAGVGELAWGTSLYTTLMDHSAFTVTYVFSSLQPYCTQYNHCEQACSTIQNSATPNISFQVADTEGFITDSTRRYLLKPK